MIALWLETASFVTQSQTAYLRADSSFRAATVENRRCSLHATCRFPGAGLLKVRSFASLQSVRRR